MEEKVADWRRRIESAQEARQQLQNRLSSIMRPTSITYAPDDNVNVLVYDDDGQILVLTDQ